MVSQMVKPSVANSSAHPQGERRTREAVVMETTDVERDLSGSREKAHSQIAEVTSPQERHARRSGACLNSRQLEGLDLREARKRCLKTATIVGLRVREAALLSAIAAEFIPDVVRHAQENVDDARIELAARPYGDFFAGGFIGLLGTIGTVRGDGIEGVGDGGCERQESDRPANGAGSLSRRIFPGVNRRFPQPR